jgi:hypothetical protein
MYAHMGALNVLKYKLVASPAALQLVSLAEAVTYGQWCKGISKEE